MATAKKKKRQQKMYRATSYEKPRERKGRLGTGIAKGRIFLGMKEERSRKEILVRKIQSERKEAEVGEEGDEDVRAVHWKRQRASKSFL